MTVYSSTRYTNETSGSRVLASPGSSGDTVRALIATVALDTNATTGDTVNFGYVPRGATIIDATILVDALDTNMSLAIVFDVGDTKDTDSIFSGLTTAQLGGVADTPEQSAIGAIYATRTAILATITTGAGTAAAGNMTLVLLFTVDGAAGGSA